MSQPPPHAPVPSRARTDRLLVAAVVLAPVALAVACWIVPPRVAPLLPCAVSHFPRAGLTFDQRELGPAPGPRPRITNVRVVDLDKDGRSEVLVCDAQRNRVFLYRPGPDGAWNEIPIGDELNGPAGAVPVDLDKDGDLDLVVSVLGGVLPTDEAVGQVVWLENRGGTFVTHVLLDHVRRVSDVQPADLDGDGDVDLAVAVFGYTHGEILWLENRDGGRFRDHQLFATRGPSHVPIADFDGDGRPDIAALVSQDHEEVWLFRNRGGGEFAPARVFHTLNFDLGGAGLTVADLDRDGRPDLLLVAGDNLEVNHHHPQPWHGCLWLRNTGGRFDTIRIADVGGVYAAAVADLDGDGDNDVVLASMFNDWHRPGAASLVLLENDGNQNFTAKTLADRPIHLATVATGDLDGDGRPDVVAGSLFLDTPPPERAGRVTAWLSRTGGAK